MHKAMKQLHRKVVCLDGREGKEESTLKKLNEKEERKEGTRG